MGTECGTIWRIEVHGSSICQFIYSLGHVAVYVTVFFVSILEQGIITTVVESYGRSTSFNVRHLPKFPGYDNITDILHSTPGIQFEDWAYEFMSVDVDFRNKSAYFYNKYTRYVTF